MEIKVDTQSQAFVAAVDACLHSPELAPRGLKVMEVPERLTLVVERPQDGFVATTGRKFNHAITAVEGLSLVGQCSVPELQTDRVKSLASFQSGSVFRGAYGPRAEGALDDIVALLLNDPDSRQAVLSIFESRRDLGRWGEGSRSGDVPCTVAIQFMIRGGLLEMWVVMRSNDVWLGLPYDLGQFSLLQMAVAGALGVRAGRYYHSAGSMHLYERNYGAAATVGDPVSERVVGPFGAFGYSPREGMGFANVASRARRLLLGQPLDGQVSLLEEWLECQLAPKP